MFFKDIEGKLILADLSEDFLIKEKLIGTEDFVFTEISETVFNALKLKGIKHQKKYFK